MTLTWVESAVYKSKNMFLTAKLRVYICWTVNSKPSCENGPTRQRNVYGGTEGAIKQVSQRNDVGSDETSTESCCASCGVGKSPHYSSTIRSQERRVLHISLFARPFSFSQGCPVVCEATEAV